MLRAGCLAFFTVSAATDLAGRIVAFAAIRHLRSELVLLLLRLAMLFADR